MISFFKNLQLKHQKQTLIISSVGGFVADFLSPLGPVLKYISFLSFSILLIIILIYFLKKSDFFRNLIFPTSTFSVITTFFFLINSFSTNGVLSDNISFINDFQQQLSIVKEDIKRVEKKVEVTTTDPIGAGKNYDNLGNYEEAEKYYLIGLDRLKKHEIGSYLYYNLLLTELSFKYQDYEKSIYYSNQIIKVYPLFDQAISLKVQSLLKLNRQKEFIELSKKYLDQANKIGDTRFFTSSIDSFKLKNRIDERINDYSINGSGSNGFRLELSGYKFRLGNVGLFNSVLGNYTEINSKLYGIDSTLDFLESLNSSTQIINSYEDKKGPYYLPKFRYTTKTNNPKEKVLIASSGKIYEGPYYKDFQGLLWTNSSPSECPCLRLISEKEYMKIHQNFIKNDWQVYSYMGEGWYSLLNKDYIKSRKLFGKIIYYLIHNDINNYKKLFEFIDKSIVDLDINKPRRGYQGLRDIVDLESAKYDGNQDLTFLKALTDLPIVYNSDDLCNSIINFAHTYLIEDNIEEALKIYKYLNQNHLIKSFDLTVEQAIKQDISKFENKGIIEKGVLNKIINSL
tara:strand:- start:840 stop:2546 length:1707 start_codon:yes stop_codon:yes gene_type:complete